MSDNKELTDGRDEAGKFVKGVSGNPAGRPKGTRNHIVQLKQNLEAAVRENVTPEDIQAIISTMVAQAKAGDIQAAKIILDKTISNAKIDEEANESAGGIKVIVENATFLAETNQKSPIEGEKVINEESS